MKRAITRGGQLWMEKGEHRAAATHIDRARSGPGRGVWDSSRPSRQPSPKPLAPARLPYFPSPRTGTRQHGTRRSLRRYPPQSARLRRPVMGTWRIATPGMISEMRIRARAPMKPAMVPAIGSSASGEDWNLVDLAGPRSHRRGRAPGRTLGDPEERLQPSTVEEASEEVPPLLPPRTSHEATRAPPHGRYPSRKHIRFEISTGTTRSATQNPRTSPILVQKCQRPMSPRGLGKCAGFNYGGGYSPTRRWWRRFDHASRSAWACSWMRCSMN